MWKAIKDKWKEWCIKGVNLPYAHDPVTGKPSITLLFPYITFVLAVGSVIALHFKVGMLIATVVAIMFWALSVVFYMIRKLNKAKLDLNDGTIELDNGESEE